MSGYSSILTPTMTGYTSPSGIVTCLDDYDPTGVYAWKAFDRNFNTGWASYVIKNWIAYEFTVAKRVTRYEIRPHPTYTPPTNAPASWTFEGWDGSSWIVLSTVVNEWWNIPTFKGWEFTNENSYIKYRFNITSNCGRADLYIAEIRLYAPTYTINASAGANGSISDDGNTTVDTNTNKTYTITPASGYEVLDVLVDGESVGAVEEYEFENITADHTISATFAIMHIISASAGTGGSISPAGEVKVAEGTDKTFTITPDFGYGIDDVLVDSSSVGAVSEYEFKNVTATHVIIATFVSVGSPDVASVAKPIKIETTKEINEAWTASMDIIPDENIDTECYVKIEGEDYLAEKVIDEESGGEYIQKVQLFHNMKELADLTIDRFYLTKSPEDILSYILSGSGWSAGTCDIDEIVAVWTDKRTSRLEALNLLAERCGGELYFQSLDRKVDLKRQIGTYTGLHIRYDKNSKYIKRTKDSTGLITRIYPYGPDNWEINTTILDNCEDETAWTPSGGASVAASTEIKMQGKQGIEITATALDETFINDLGAGDVKDLSGHDLLKFRIYSAENNANGYTFGIGESAYTENTVNTGALEAGCWIEVELDLSGVADADKNAIRYIGFKNLTDGASVAVIDNIRATNGDIYIDSPYIGLYKINKEYVYRHSAKPEKEQFEKRIYPTDDAYTHQYSPNKNYGSNMYLEARNSAVYDYISFMKFAFPEVPVGATIVSATLTLDCYWIKNGGVTVRVRTCDASWGENTITYNNQPGADAAVGNIDMTEIKTVTLDITDEVDDWYNSVINNYGLIFDVAVLGEDKISAWHSNDSPEGKPYINLIYTLDTDPSPVIRQAAIECLYEHHEPKLSYEVKLSDLSRVMINKWRSETINIGDTVKIYDSDIGLNVDVRVRKITKNPLDPTDLDIQFVNKASTIIDTQAEIAKKLSYAMPYEDNKKIIDANAVQEGYLGGSVNK